MSLANAFKLPFGMKNLKMVKKAIQQVPLPRLSPTRVVIIDYGMGNLRSVQKAFEKVGFAATITNNPDKILKADKIVLPGVGAFQACMQNLKKQNLIEPIHEVIRMKKPFLGICMGLQVLLDESEEFGRHRGLGLIRGKVVRFKLAKKYKIPHMGWNRISKKKASPLLADVSEGAHFYFVHSYHVALADSRQAATTTEYGNKAFTSMIERDNLFACQFHPEKSQTEGLRLIRSFARL